MAKYFIEKTNFKTRRTIIEKKKKDILKKCTIRNLQYRHNKRNTTKMKIIIYLLKQKLERI
jgi:hypothetical protein